MNSPPNMVKTIQYVLIAFCLVFIGSAFGQDKGVTLDPKNFAVLGIKLGTSTVGDVERAFGPAKVRQSGRSEQILRCYVSMGQDRTVLEFENWIDDLIEFRLYQGSPESIKRCAFSNRISPSISTLVGLRLGMSRGQVIRLIGYPTQIRGDRFDYESSFLRQPKVKERPQTNESYSSGPRLDAIEVYEKLELRFRGSKLAVIDATRSETS